jgi:hypothetical protein
METLLYNILNILIIICFHSRKLYKKSFLESFLLSSFIRKLISQKFPTEETLYINKINVLRDKFPVSECGNNLEPNGSVMVAEG